MSLGWVKTTFSGVTAWYFMCVPEVSKTSALLQSLSKHFIFADVIVTDRAPGKSHCLLEVVSSDLWDWIVVFILQTEKVKHY